MTAEREVMVTPTGQLVENVHPEATCIPPCPVHAPSDHVMAGFPLHWRNDRGIFERICPHGVGHPDPDGMAFIRSTTKHDDGTHGCDGCCRGDAS